MGTEPNGGPTAPPSGGLSLRGYGQHKVKGRSRLGDRPMANHSAIRGLLKDATRNVLSARPLDQLDYVR